MTSSFALGQQLVLNITMTFICTQDYSGPCVAYAKISTTFRHPDLLPASAKTANKPNFSLSRKRSSAKTVVFFRTLNGG